MGYSTTIIRTSSSAENKLGIRPFPSILENLHSKSWHQDVMSIAGTAPEPQPLRRLFCAIVGVSEEEFQNMGLHRCGQACGLKYQVVGLLLGVDGAEQTVRVWSHGVWFAIG